MSGWELFLNVALAVLGCLPLVREGSIGRWVAGVVTVMIFGGLFAGVLSRRVTPTGHEVWSIPTEIAEGEFVSSSSCRSCHPQEYHSWHATYHRTMTQRATLETVLAPIDHVRLSSRGRTCELTKQGDRFLVRMVDPDWEEEALRRGIDVLAVAHPPFVTRPIVLTTGSHHYQAYWIAGRRGNELRQVPFVYHLKEKRWIPREDAFLFPPDAGRQFATWNAVCIQCHSVAGEPAHDRTSNALFSRVVEFGIACESCHGPARAHVRRHCNPLNRYRQQLGVQQDATIVNPARLDHKASSEVCGQCHATFFPKNSDEFWDHGYRRSYRPGRSLEASRQLLKYVKNPTDPDLVRWLRGNPGSMESRFWPDGSSRVGGREFLAMRNSNCYTRGKMSCLSCHSMHHSHPDDQLAKRMDGNHACLQCHTEYRDRIESHTHHRPDSTGSRCYNCHMPHASYALFKAIRSHTIDSPRVVKQPVNSKPNACNLCHLDRSQQWAANRLTQWYRQKPVALTGDERESAAGVLWILKGDAAQRALVAWHFGWKPAQQASGSEWMAPFLAQLLDDSYSAVRFIAGRELKSLRGFSKLEYDFLATPAKRKHAKHQAIRTWRATSVLKQRRSSPDLPFQPNGTLSQQRIEHLLKQRDNRPIYIAE